jgi:hypothetical protein
MKLDELFAEQSSKPVSKAVGVSARPSRPPKTPKSPTRKDTPKKAPKKLASRAEVLEAVQLLSGGNVRVSSINGGKQRRGRRP